MNFLEKPFLWRVVLNLPVGSMAIITCFLLMEVNDEGLKIRDFIKEGVVGTFIADNKFIFSVVFLSIILIMGEMLSLLGEILLNIFFEFKPLKEKDVLEKVSPSSKEKIYYEDILNLSEAGRSISEIHFAISRMMGGVGVVFAFNALFVFTMLYGNKVGLSLTDSIISVAVSILLSSVVVFFTFYLVKIIFFADNASERNENNKVTFVLKASKAIKAIITFILIVCFCFLVIEILKEAEHYSTIFLILFLISLAVFCFFSAVQYRTFANRIIFANVKDSKQRNS